MRHLHGWQAASLSIAAALALSFLFVGYSVYSSDQRVYFPQIEAAEHPGTLSRDLLTSFQQSNLSLFAPAVEELRKMGLDIAVVSLAGIVLARLMLFASFYGLVYLLTRNRLVSALGVIMFAATAGFVVPVQGLALIDKEFTPRTIAFAIGCCGLVSTLARRHITASFLYGVAFLILQRYVSHRHRGRSVTQTPCLWSFFRVVFVWLRRAAALRC